MADHERIWLEHPDAAMPEIGRMWCEDVSVGDDATQYVRADLFDTLRAENERLKSFARRIIGTSAFEGNDLDGSYVQMLAENRGLITRCIYDPERHGPSEYAEPGDEFYEFAPILCGPALSEPAQ